MKVSVAWLQQYLDFPLPPIETLTVRIGAQLGEIESVTDTAAAYQGAIVVTIVSAQDHPDSDHMHVCLIDDGQVAIDVDRTDSGLVQVVCGAPNVRAGMQAVWLPPGVTVPESYSKDPFVLGKRELRGVLSNGMLASPHELALSEDHSGILEITQSTAPGTAFAESYQLQDYIIDIENKMFTHRPDCFGQLGVAREVAGILGQPFHSPGWYQADAVIQSGATKDSLQVINEVPELVPRFSAVCMDQVTIGPSRPEIQSYFARLGIRPINTVVDLTNYYMHLTGQPLHAYDYDKVLALSDRDVPTLVVRNPRENETLTLLNGKTITPRKEAVVIATPRTVIGLGGIMGGAATEIDAATKRIIIECASFDMYSIRRSSMEHGVFSDAVTRFNKGQSPLQTMVVLAEICRELTTYGASVMGTPVDDNHLGDEVMARSSLYPNIPITAQFVNDRLGLSLDMPTIQTLLTNVECQVAIDGDTAQVTAPFWRTDIETREDIVEEVGRLKGFDSLPLDLPQHSIVPISIDPMLHCKQQLRTILARAGANELLTYSFVHGKLLARAEQDSNLAYKLTNALSPDLQYFRLGLTPSLLEKVRPNIKAGYREFAIFELGKGHNLLHSTDEDDGVPPEFDFLDLVYTTLATQSAFYQARAFLDFLGHELGLSFRYAAITEDPHLPAADPYEISRAAYVYVGDGQECIGIIGEFKPAVQAAFKLPIATAGFSIEPAGLLRAQSKLNPAAAYQALPKFPSVHQDITLEVPVSIAYGTLERAFMTALDHHKPDHTLTRARLLDIYQAPDATVIRYTFHVQVASYEHTLTESVVSELLGSLSETLASQFSVTRI